MRTVCFSTAELLNMLKINRNDLYTILRPVRSGGKLLSPIFTPEIQCKIVNNWIFTQRDIMKLSRYFKALKQLKEARADLKKTGQKPDTRWLQDEE